MIDDYEWYKLSDHEYRWWFGKIIDKHLFTGFYIRPINLTNKPICTTYECFYFKDYDFSIYAYTDMIAEDNNPPNILVDYFKTNLWLLDINNQRKGWKIPV